MFCYQCGNEIPEGTNICPKCGAALHIDGGMKGGQAATITSSATKAVNRLANQIDAATGGEGHVELRFRDFFVNVFKKHTEDEQNEIFACGSKRTTPAPKDIAKEWPRPWYYSRIFMTLLVSTVLMYLLYTNLDMWTILPGLMFVGAMLGVCPVLMFFYEVNSPRNISFITVLEMFFLGGCLSIVFSVLLNTLIPGGIGEIIPSMLTGVVEETGKALAIVFFISRYKDKNYILNGLLIGSAVGAGFAVL